MVRAIGSIAWVPLFLAALGCGDDYRLRIRFEPESHAAIVDRIDVWITESCRAQAIDGRAPLESLRRISFRRGESPPAIGELAAGSYGFYGFGTSVECNVVATGCSDVRLTEGGGGDLVMLLFAVDGPHCEEPGACRDGQCTASPDGSGLDGGALDGSALDGGADEADSSAGEEGGKVIDASTCGCPPCASTCVLGVCIPDPLACGAGETCDPLRGCIRAPSCDFDSDCPRPSSSCLEADCDSDSDTCREVPDDSRDDEGCEMGGRSGVCQGGVCCTGCWDDATCRAGSTDIACGTGGSACEDCRSSGSSCVDGACAASCSDVFDTCFIDGQCYARDAANQRVPCEVCRPERSRVSWSPADMFGACTAAGDPGTCGSGFGGTGLEPLECCTGCWDPFDGQCKPGTLTSACGRDGDFCELCGSGADCLNGACTPD